MVNTGEPGAQIHKRSSSMPLNSHSNIERERNRRCKSKGIRKSERGSEKSFSKEQNNVTKINSKNMRGRGNETRRDEDLTKNNGNEPEKIYKILKDKGKAEKRENNQFEDGERNKPRKGQPDEPRNGTGNRLPELRPMMLDFARATKRKQPVDLLAWSREYFEALSRGSPLRELSKAGRRGQLSASIIGALHHGLGERGFTVSAALLREHWAALRLSPDLLARLLDETRGSDRVVWLKLVSAMSARISDDVDRSMLICLTVLASHGCSERVALSDFHSVFVYHLELFDGDIGKYVVSMMAWLDSKVNVTSGYIAVEDLVV